MVFLAFAFYDRLKYNNALLQTRQGNAVEEHLRIHAYVMRAALEASLDMVKATQQPICIVKFSLAIDLEDAFTFKHALEYLYAQTQAGPLFYHEDGSFVLVLHHTKIHQAKTLLQHLKREITLRFPALFGATGITLLDKEDTYTTLTKRLEGYFSLSKHSPHKKICCGTKAHNPYENKDQNTLLSQVFKQHAWLKLHNLYKGVPIIEKSAIIAYSEGKLLVGIDKAKIPFYQNELYTYFQHDFLASTVRASIAKVDTKGSLLVLTRLEFLENAAIERRGVRIEPDRKIYASALLGPKRVCEGELGNISEGSMVIKTTQAQIQRFLHSSVGEEVLEVTFQLPTQKNLITTIKTKASVFNIMDENIVLTLHLSDISKTKVRNYLAMQTETIVSAFKQSLKNP